MCFSDVTVLSLRTVYFIVAMSKCIPGSQQPNPQWIDLWVATNNRGPDMEPMWAVVQEAVPRIVPWPCASACSISLSSSSESLMASAESFSDALSLSNASIRSAPTTEICEGGDGRTALWTTSCDEVIQHLMNSCRRTRSSSTLLGGWRLSSMFRLDCGRIATEG